jgi:hypothetical protein
VDGLRSDEFARLTPSGWTISATLAHLSFWDDWVAERWRRWLTVGHFDEFPDEVMDLVNAAAIRVWTLVPPQRAKSAVLEAAEQVAALIGRLPEAALEDALATGRAAMIDRSLHWVPHMDEVREARET